jgi:outer membrane protein OmpA-like peptidoglycan-associated protein
MLRDHVRIDVLGGAEKWDLHPTDSQGAATANQELSQRRARAVRDYLVSRGISADRVTSQGFGSNRPIGDNATAEGRANNRRVEIVVQPTR